jgi:2-phosphoglycerate kinase
VREMDLKVRKRDGNEEPWSDDKLVTSMTKAGVADDAASAMAAKIKDWAKDAAENGVIASSEIRGKVIENLEADYPEEADSYRAFKKG